MCMKLMQYAVAKSWPNKPPRIPDLLNCKGIKFRFLNLSVLKMSELKLRKLMEHMARLKEQLDMPRIRVSEASEWYISSS